MPHLFVFVWIFHNHLPLYIVRIHVYSTITAYKLLKMQIVPYGNNVNRIFMHSKDKVDTSNEQYTYSESR